MSAALIDVPAVIPQSFLSDEQKDALLSYLGTRFLSVKIERDALNLNDVVTVDAGANGQEPAVIERTIENALKKFSR
jgi:hypothetical protein